MASDNSNKPKALFPVATEFVERRKNGFVEREQFNAQISAVKQMLEQVIYRQEKSNELMKRLESLIQLMPIEED